MLRVQRLEVADRETGVGVRRPDRAQDEASVGPLVGAVALRSQGLDLAIDLDHSGAHRMAGRQRGRGWTPSPTLPRFAGEGFQSNCEDCFDDLAIAGAAAEHAAEGIQHLRLGRRGIARQQIVGRHQHARRADAALSGAVRQKCALEGAHGPVGETFDRHHLPVLHLRRRDHTGADLPAVDPHGAGAAVAGIAADLRAGEPEVLAQHVGQPPHRIDMDLDPAAIQGEGDLLCRRSHAARSRRARWTSVSAASRR
jgi:hypothetical protein